MPKENLVGEENGGWEVVQTMLSYERIAIGPVAATRSLIDRLVEYMKDTPERQWGNSRQALAQLNVEAEIGRLICYRLAWLNDNGTATAKTHPSYLVREANAEKRAHGRNCVFSLDDFIRKKVMLTRKNPKRDSVMDVVS